MIFRNDEVVGAGIVPSYKSKGIDEITKKTEIDLSVDNKSSKSEVNINDFKVE